jgi:hypothetical protein
VISLVLESAVRGMLTGGAMSMGCVFLKITKHTVALVRHIYCASISAHASVQHFVYSLQHDLPLLETSVAASHSADSVSF